MLREFKIPRELFFRRLQSLTGIFLVLFLIEHLLTNSQAALPLGDYGMGFVRAVDAIHNLPYLRAIEIFFLATPFIVHAVWGLEYARQAKLNSGGSDGTRPSLRRYARNHAFSWQRITAWILLIGLILHVGSMRFVKYPEKSGEGVNTEFTVQVSEDPGLKSLEEKIGFRLEPSPKEGKVLAVAKSFGVASLLVVRDTFKSWLMVALYSIFVVAATYHAFNGLWTASITWGLAVTERSQRLVLRFSQGLMAVVTFLGLAAVWLTYFNLKQ